MNIKYIFLPRFHFKLYYNLTATSRYETDYVLLNFSIASSSEDTKKISLPLLLSYIKYW